MYKIIIVVLSFLFLQLNSFAQNSVQVFSVESINISEKTKNFGNGFLSEVDDLKNILKGKLDVLKQIYVFSWKNYRFEVKSNIDDFVMNGRSKRNKFIITIFISH